MDEEIFIARQPILNREKHLFAYELLFRKKQGDTHASIINDMEATAQVLDNALTNVGITKLVGNKLAFVNCSYEFLTSEILYMLDSKVFVLEILETIKIDDKIIEIVKDFHEKGYTIAIDDFVLNQKELLRVMPLLPYISIVKLEFPSMNALDIEKTVKIFHERNIKILAEKIETEKDFNICYDLGCDLFQGYFFAKPENLSATKLNASAIAVFDLLKSIDKQLELNQLEMQFKHQPELSVNLIKYLNSVNFGLRSQITSIRHAITLLGYSNLKRWLLILAYANHENINEHSPLLENALHRGVLLEELSKYLNLGKDIMEKAYLMGLISHLDALYKISMESVLEQMHLDSEINEAFTTKRGVLGKLLVLSQALESDNFCEIEQSLSHLSLSMENMNAALLKAYETSSN